MYCSIVANVRTRKNLKRKDRRKRKEDEKAAAVTAAVAASAAANNASATGDELATSKKTRTTTEACGDTASAVTTEETDRVNSTYAGDVTNFLDGLPYGTTGDNNMPDARDTMSTKPITQEAIRNTQSDDIVHPPIYPSSSSSSGHRESYRTSMTNRWKRS